MHPPVIRCIYRKGEIPPTKGIKQMATITPKELAAELDTDPRTLRKFLRSPQGFDAKVGKGHRWSIESRQVRSLKVRFAKWVASNATPAATESDAPDAD